MILVSLISLGSLFYVMVPQKITNNYTSTTTLTAVNLEVIADYSTSSVSCTGTVPVCFGQVFPFTLTQTFSGQTTQTILAPSTSTGHVRYAGSGTNASIALALLVILLVAGAILLVRDRRLRNA